MKVQLTYFKDTGKYYAEGEYETEKVELYDIWDEVRGMQAMKVCPELRKGHFNFTILVNVAGHEHEHPRLLLGDVV